MIYILIEYKKYKTGNLHLFSKHLRILFDIIEQGKSIKPGLCFTLCNLKLFWKFQNCSFYLSAGLKLRPFLKWEQVNKVFCSMLAKKYHVRVIFQSQVMQLSAICTLPSPPLNSTTSILLVVGAGPHSGCRASFHGSLRGGCSLVPLWSTWLRAEDATPTAQFDNKAEAMIDIGRQIDHRSHFSW